MRRVLHVGPCNTPGGIAKVIEILSGNPPNGWTADTLNTHSNKGRISKLLAWNSAKRFMINNGKSFDVIHIHSAADWSYRRKLSLAKIAHKQGLKVIFHIHSGKFDTFAAGRKDIQNELKDFEIVVLSDYWRNKLEPIIGPSNVINNPVDPKLLSNHIHKKREKQILLLGRPDPVKGHDFAFKIARKLRDSGWNLVTTGSNHTETGIQGVGWLSEQEKYALLNESSILIIPSKYEGQPMVMIEGLAAKCIVIASDKIPDLPDCVVAAKFNDIDDWVEKIKTANYVDTDKCLGPYYVNEISQRWGKLYNSIVTN